MLRWWRFREDMLQRLQMPALQQAAGQYSRVAPGVHRLQREAVSAASESKSIKSKA